MNKNVNPMTVPLGAGADLLEYGVALDFGIYQVVPDHTAIRIGKWIGDHWETVEICVNSFDGTLKAFQYIEKQMKIPEKTANG